MVHSNFLILNSGMMEDNTPVYAMSRYGRPVIILGPYRYNKRSASTGKRARWACVRTGHGCKAILITWENRIIDYVHEHNHWKRISAKLNSTHGNIKRFIDPVPKLRFNENKSISRQGDNSILQFWVRNWIVIVLTCNISLHNFSMFVMVNTIKVIFYFSFICMCMKIFQKYSN